MRFLHDFLSKVNWNNGSFLVITCGLQNTGYHQPEQTEVLERLSSWPRGYLLAVVHLPENESF